MSLLRLFFAEVINEDIHIWSSLFRQEVNIPTYVNSISISETSRKSCNQEHFALTFPEPPMPGRKERSRLGELEITVPKQVNTKIEEGQKPAHTWKRHSVKFLFQWQSICLTFQMQAPSRLPYSSQIHPIEAETQKFTSDKKAALKKDFKKKTDPHVTNPKSKKIIKDDKPQRRNKGDKNPSKSLNESKQIKKTIFKSETIPVFKDSKLVSKTVSNFKTNSDNSKESDPESICRKNNISEDSNTSQKNSDRKSETYSINSSNVNLLMCLEESVGESMDFDLHLNNYSHNNSKKPAKKDTKKSSDAESGDSKDAAKDAKKDKKAAKKDDKKKDGKNVGSTDAESADKKDAKKGAKKDPKAAKKDDKKKDAKKEAESTDAESGDSKDAKKDTKKDKKTSKKDDKKKGAKKEAESTDAESGDSKDAKKDTKKDKKPSKKDDKKKDAKKEAESTDVESGDSKDTKKGAKKDQKPSKKDSKKKDEKKGTVLTDSESELESKKGKKDDKKEKKDSKKKSVKKDTASSGPESTSEGDSKKSKKADKRKDAKKPAESTESESDLGSKKGKKVSKEKKGLKKEEKKEAKKDTESTDAESDRSLNKAKGKIGLDDSDATSTDSKKGISEIKRGSRMSSKKTTFSEKGKITITGRVPPSRERPPLPPCEPFLPLPRIKRLCKCRMPPPPPKPRYAPLPEAEWIHKLL